MVCNFPKKGEEAKKNRTQHRKCNKQFYLKHGARYYYAALFFRLLLITLLAARAQDCSRDLIIMECITHENRLIWI